MKKIRFYKGSKLFSVALILFSGLIAAGLLWGANMYYDIDTGKIIVQEVQNVISAVSPQFKVAYDTALTKYLQISVADTGKTTLSTSHGLDITAAATSTWKTTAGPLTIKTEETGANLYIDSSGDIRATSTKSIYLTADDDFYINFDAANLFALKGSGTEYLRVIPGVTLGDDATSTTIDGSLITLSGNTYATGTLTVGADASGYTVTFYGDESGKKMVWDDASSTLVITGAAAANAKALEIASGDALIKGNVTVGQSDAGYNVTFYGSSGGAQMEWATSTNKLTVTGVSGQTALKIAAGNAVLAENLEVRGGNITTNQTNFNLLNTVASTINFAGAANLIKFGTTTALTTVRSGQDLMIDASGTLTIEFSTSTGGFILRSESPVVKYLEIGTDGKLTLRSGGSADIVLDAASGAVRIAENDTLYVDNIAIGGEGKLIGIVPIFGFDLPAQTASTSFVRISRTIENYPFPTAATGTSRVNKLVTRYSATSTLTAGANAVEMRVSTTTGATYSSFYLPRPISNDTEKGEARIVQVNIPTSTPWWLDIRNATTSSAVRVFQIFLAAFDVKQ